MCFNDLCTANEPRPTIGRPGNGPDKLTGRFIIQANINNMASQLEDAVKTMPVPPGLEEPGKRSLPQEQNWSDERKEPQEWLVAGCLAVRSILSTPKIKGPVVASDHWALCCI